jgi:hypothetical protein
MTADCTIDVSTRKKDKRLIDNLLSDLTCAFGIIHSFCNTIYTGPDINEIKNFFMN